MKAPESQTGKTSRIVHESLHQAQNEASERAYTKRTLIEEKEALKEFVQSNKITELDAILLENDIGVARTDAVDEDHDHIKSFLENRLGGDNKNNGWDR